MRLAICDDELSCQEQLLDLLKDYTLQNPSKKITYQVFSDPEMLCDTASSSGFDVYFLDILMPKLNGIQLGQKLREANFNGKIIYLTSSKEYALDSYQVKAWNYLLKPISKECFFSMLDELFLLYSKQQNHFLLVKTPGGNVKLFFQDILYTELNKRKILFYLTNGTIVESVSIRTSFTEAVSELFKDSRFILCSPGTAVNLEYITMVSHDSIVFRGNHQLYLPKKGCREARSAWYDYCFHEEEFYDTL